MIFLPPPQQGHGAAMPGMTLGISRIQCPDGTPRGSVVPTGRSLFSSRFQLPPEPSTMPSLRPVGVYNGPDVVQPEARRKVPAGHAASLVGHGRSCRRVANPPRHVPLMPAGQASGRCQNKHSGMATLTFAFREQTLGEGGSSVIFCRLVTRRETTCSTWGVWDRICPHNFPAIPNAPRLTPSTRTSSPAEPAAMSRALAMFPGVSVGLNISCHALLSPCQDWGGPQGSSPTSGRVERGTGAAGRDPSGRGQAPLGSPHTAHPFPQKIHPATKVVTAPPDAGDGSSPSAWLVAVAGV